MIVLVWVEQSEPDFTPHLLRFCFFQVRAWDFDWQEWWLHGTKGFFLFVFFFLLPGSPGSGWVIRDRFHSHLLVTPAASTWFPNPLWRPPIPPPSPLRPWRRWWRSPAARGWCRGRRASGPRSGGVRSWRSCWRCWAPGRAAGRWWSAFPWTGVCSPWRWRWACDAAGPWRLDAVSWALCCGPCVAPVLCACRLGLGGSGGRDGDESGKAEEGKKRNKQKKYKVNTQQWLRSQRQNRKRIGGGE